MDGGKPHANILDFKRYFHDWCTLELPWKLFCSPPDFHMLMQIPKSGKGKQGAKPVNKDRFVSKMFLRGDSVILVLRNPKWFRNICWSELQVCIFWFYEPKECYNWECITLGMAADVLACGWFAAAPAAFFSQSTYLQQFVTFIGADWAVCQHFFIGVKEGW